MQALASAETQIAPICAASPHRIASSQADHNGSIGYFAWAG
jgi:hypothetical protein